jgi:hypothetical protein
MDDRPEGERSTNAAGISTIAIWACHQRVPKGSHETKIEEMRLYEDPDSF